MTALPPDLIDRAALAWLVRLQDPAFDDWDAWEAWLTEDPRHAEAYWRLAEDDAALPDPAAVTARATLGGVQPAPALRQRPRSRRAARPTAPSVPRRWGVLAGAAVVAAACGLAWLTFQPPAGRWIETGPAQTRSLALADGSAVYMSGDTRLRLADDGAGVELERGRAMFEVVHDDRRTFTVTAGGVEIVDMGTAFDVTRLPDGVRVAVSEGEVRVDADGRAETVAAGGGLVVSSGDRRRLEVDPVDVGAWRTGRLSYRGEPLSLVAGDLGRALGIGVEVSPSLADRPFTGSLQTTGSREEVRSVAEDLLDVKVVIEGERWRLDPRPGR